MKYYVKVENKEYEVELDSASDSDVDIRVDGRLIHMDPSEAGSNISYLLDQVHYETAVRSNNSHEYVVTVDGLEVMVMVEDELEKRFERQSSRKKAAKNIDVLKAPMPGLIVTVEVEEGEQVQAGDGLIIMEAMKMENELKAPHKGVVKTVHVQQGDKVEMNTVLVTIDFNQGS